MAKLFVDVISHKVPGDLRSRSICPAEASNGGSPMVLADVEKRIDSFDRQLMKVAHATSDANSCT